VTSTQNVAAVTTEDFDLVVLGSGEGSKFLAWTLARQGERVAFATSPSRR
jgi:pyruvate/2-oxoglutarate dehydrogenase complex dihydrolipoamide dehydrogenase (E3) component